MARDFEESPARGTERCPGPGWAELCEADTKPVPEFLKKDSYEYMGSQPLSAARYTSPDFFRQEVEKMWPNVWQFAAREEELPEPGDVVVYENAGRSYLVVRQDDGSVRAFHNVCLHRGRKLRLEFGLFQRLQMPVPRLHLEHQRHLEGNSLPLGFQPSQRRKHEASGSARRALGRLHFSL